MTQQSQGLWAQYEAQQIEAALALGAFLNSVGDPVPFLRRKIRLGDHGLATLVLWQLSEEHQRRALPELVFLASLDIGDVRLIRRMIKSLDREWVRANIWPLILHEIGPEATDEQYRLLSGLLEELGFDDLLAELYRRASQNSDPEIRDVAEGHEDLMDPAP